VPGDSRRDTVAGWIFPREYWFLYTRRLIVLYSFQVSGWKQEEELSLVQFLYQPDGRVDCGTNFAFGKQREP
jgi:hypothetical protein